MKKGIITVFITLLCGLSLSLAVACSKKEEEKKEAPGEVTSSVESLKEKATDIKEEAEEVAEDIGQMGKEAKGKMEEAAGAIKEETMERYSGLKEEVKSMVVATNTAGDPSKGKEKFEQICASCHGPEGKGDGPAAAALEPKPRDLSDASYVSTLSDEHLFKVIKEGGAAVGKSPLMPAWGNTLSDGDINNVIAFIRKELCKCEYKGN
ncbi:hypothetical protein HRbin37_01282 [bacterium HR37]|nr:hypothetical protein HRbin37_01282 [bacterium HR37]